MDSILTALDLMFWRVMIRQGLTRFMVRIECGRLKVMDYRLNQVD
jgi:hypothetical protein